MILCRTDGSINHVHVACTCKNTKQELYLSNLLMIKLFINDELFWGQGVLFTYLYIMVVLNY